MKRHSVVQRRSRPKSVTYKTVTNKNAWFLWGQRRSCLVSDQLLLSLIPFRNRYRRFFLINELHTFNFGFVWFPFLLFPSPALKAVLRSLKGGSIRPVAPNTIKHICNFYAHLEHQKSLCAIFFSWIAFNSPMLRDAMMLLSSTLLSAALIRHFVATSIWFSENDGSWLLCLERELEGRADDLPSSSRQPAVARSGSDYSAAAACPPPTGEGVDGWDGVGIYPGRPSRDRFARRILLYSSARCFFSLAGGVCCLCRMHAATSER